MKRRSFSFCGLILLADLVSAGGVGTTAVPLLQLETGARGLGMGSAYTTLASGANALFWNPAGLSSEKDVDVVLDHQPLMQVLNYDGASLALPVNSWHIGLGYSQLKSKPIDGLDSSGNSAGSSFDTQDQLAIVGVARAWNNWNSGMSAKWMRSSLANVSASAWALDFGINSPRYASGYLQHSLVLQNIGNKIRYQQTSESLPAQLKLGTLLRLSSSLRLGADIIQANNNTHAGIGTEYELPLFNNSGAAFLRAGYTTAGTDVGTGFSMGAGFSIRGLKLDFAWVPQNDFGSSEVFSLGYRLGHTGAQSAEAPSRSVNEISAPAAPVVAPAPTPPVEYKNGAPSKSRVYIIQRGDTLGIIAQRMYGDSRLWTVLYTANRHLIDSPDNLTVGQRIMVPYTE